MRTTFIAFITMCSTLALAAQSKPIQVDGSETMILFGQKCADLMERRFAGLPVADVQVDEIWGFVGMKEKARKAKYPAEVELGDGGPLVEVGLPVLGRPAINGRRVRRRRDCSKRIGTTMVRQVPTAGKLRLTGSRADVHREYRSELYDFATFCQEAH